MATSPEDRFASASEVATLLEQCLAHVQQPTSVELPSHLATASATSLSSSRPNWRDAMRSTVVKLVGSWLHLSGFAVALIAVSLGAFFMCLSWLSMTATRIDLVTVPPTLDPLLQWNATQGELDVIASDIKSVDMTLSDHATKTVPRLPLTSKTLTGIWRGERDGAAVEITVSADGQTSWRVQTSMPGATGNVQAQLRLVDNHLTGQVELVCDLKSNATGVPASVRVGQLERATSETLSLKILPTAREASEQYYELLQDFPLKMALE